MPYPYLGACAFYVLRTKFARDSNTPSAIPINALGDRAQRESHPRRPMNKQQPVAGNADVCRGDRDDPMRRPLIREAAHLASELKKVASISLAAP